MVVIVHEEAKREQIDHLVDLLEKFNVHVHISKGTMQTVIGLVGETSKIDPDLIRSMEIVRDVKRIQEPYKNVNRKFKCGDTVISLKNTVIGDGGLTLIAGPCSVESQEQITAIAHEVKAAGATMLRGGAFKPRTSPYAFQGLGAEGIKMLLQAKAETGLPIVTEIMNLSQLSLFEDVDVIQVGARNMQNFDLLKELGHINKPILLKRGLSSTIEELLMSAEYIMSGGNGDVILCERGIRTFETYTRNTLDLSAVSLMKQLSHLPVIVDPSHATGIAKLVEPLSMAAVAVGTDGLIIEVHNNPARALCDGPQSLTPAAFKRVAKEVNAVHGALKAIKEGA